MEFKEIQNLIKLIDSTDLTEFKMKEGEFEIQIRTKDYYKYSKKDGAVVTQTIAPAPTPAAVVAPQAPATAAPAIQQEETPQDTPESTEKSNLLEVKSPIVGTFYRSSSPDKDPYVKIGDRIEVGSIVCIVEAMKLFNEIESEIEGKVVEILIEDSTPVEYDQALFLVDPDA